MFRPSLPHQRSPGAAAALFPLLSRMPSYRSTMSVSGSKTANPHLRPPPTAVRSGSVYPACSQSPKRAVCPARGHDRRMRGLAAGHRHDTKNVGRVQVNELRRGSSFATKIYGCVSAGSFTSGAPRRCFSSRLPTSLISSARSFMYSSSSRSNMDTK